MSTAAAVAMFIGVIAYSILGGADFGAGIWDLLAGGTERGARPREVIDHSISPVWEANHVWLIFIFVMLWTAFPTAYASITVTLFVPLTIAALGIVLRGASFAFRKVVMRTRDRRNFGAAFAFGSLLVPFCFGAIAGAIASGRVPPGGTSGDPIRSWLNPTSLLGGVLAVVVVAFLAAVYLVFDAQRLGDQEMEEYFRRRAAWCSLAAGAVALAGIGIIWSDAPYLFHGLTSRALPLVVVSALGGLASLWLLFRHRDRFARMTAIGAVGGIVLAWGVAQWPYVIPETMSISDTAAPDGTLGAVLVAAGLACVIVLPALGLLYSLDRRNLLPEEGVEEPV